MDYKFMVEGGAITRGRTQVGEVRRPLAAVSEITKSNQIAFFCQGEDWLIDRRDEQAAKIIKLVRRVKLKTKVHEHKGTFCSIFMWAVTPDDGKSPSFILTNATVNDVYDTTPILFTLYVSRHIMLN